MIEHIKKWLSDIFTEPDNRTVCPVRIVALLGSVQYLAMTWVHYFQHHVFDAQNFAIGFGTIVTGAGVALGLKKDSAPPPPKQ